MLAWHCWVNAISSELCSPAGSWEISERVCPCSSMLPQHTHRFIFQCLISTQLLYWKLSCSDTVYCNSRFFLRSRSVMLLPATNGPTTELHWWFYCRNNHCRYAQYCIQDFIRHQNAVCVKMWSDCSDLYEKEIEKNLKKNDQVRKYPVCDCV